MTTPSVPIVFLDQSGKPTEDQVKGSPCIKVGFAVRPQGDAIGQITVRNVWALVDTGMMCSSVDARLVPVSAKPLADATIVTLTGNGEAAAYRALFHFREFDRGFSELVVAVRLVTTPWRVILGRNVLRFLDLRYAAKPELALRMQMNGQAAIS